MSQLGEHIHIFLEAWKKRDLGTSKKEKGGNPDLYLAKEKLGKEYLHGLLQTHGYESVYLLNEGFQNSGNWSVPPYFAFLCKELCSKEKGDGKPTCQEGIYPILFLPEYGDTILLALGFAHKSSSVLGASVLREKIRKEYNLLESEVEKWETDITKLNDEAYGKWKDDFVFFQEYDKNSIEKNSDVEHDLLVLLALFKKTFIKESANALNRWNKVIQYDAGNRGTTHAEDSTSPQIKKGDDSTINYLLTCQRIFFGAPGTGKSCAVKKLTGEWEAEKSGDQKRIDEVKSRVFRTTFHPDYDYASFVGAYKPVPSGSGITYSFEPEIFANAYVKAWKEFAEWENDKTKELKKVWLVIEEINRGNCAQIFGDLFQLLDRKTKGNNAGFSEYEIKAGRDFGKWLIDKDQFTAAEKKNVKLKGLLFPGENSQPMLSLPPNLNILATMNTSDQSLFPMDSAFKRRWDWEYVPIDYTDDAEKNQASAYKITIGDKSYKWIDFLKVVNKKILDLTSSEDKQLGTYFVHGDVDEKTFKSKVMFYLWNDICKDEYTGNSSNSVTFMKWKKSAEETGLTEFTFNGLFEDGNSSKTLQSFMEDSLKIVADGAVSN